jgi:leucine-rich repeat protein SHOC2
VLRVKYNKLAAIPEVVFALEQLQLLDVAGNQIAALSEDITKVASLRELDVSGNRLSQIPGAAALLRHLVSLLQA